MPKMDLSRWDEKFQSNDGEMFYFRDVYDTSSYQTGEWGDGGNAFDFYVKGYAKDISFFDDKATEMEAAYRDWLNWLIESVAFYKRELDITNFIENNPLPQAVELSEQQLKESNDFKLKSQENAREFQLKSTNELIENIINNQPNETNELGTKQNLDMNPKNTQKEILDCFTNRENKSFYFKDVANFHISHEYQIIRITTYDNLKNLKPFIILEGAGEIEKFLVQFANWLIDKVKSLKREGELEWWNENVFVYFNCINKLDLRKKQFKGFVSCRIDYNQEAYKSQENYCELDAEQTKLFLDKYIDWLNYLIAFVKDAGQQQTSNEVVEQKEIQSHFDNISFWDVIGIEYHMEIQCMKTFIKDENKKVEILLNDSETVYFLILYKNWALFQLNQQLPFESFGISGFIEDFADVVNINWINDFERLHVRFKNNKTESFINTNDILNKFIIWTNELIKAVQNALNPQKSEEVKEESFTWDNTSVIGLNFNGNDYAPGVEVKVNGVSRVACFNRHSILEFVIDYKNWALKLLGDKFDELPFANDKYLFYIDFTKNILSVKWSEDSLSLGLDVSLKDGNLNTIPADFLKHLFEWIDNLMKAVQLHLNPIPKPVEEVKPNIVEVEKPFFLYVKDNSIVFGDENGRLLLARLLREVKYSIDGWSEILKKHLCRLDTCIDKLLRVKISVDLNEFEEIVSYINGYLNKKTDIAIKLEIDDKKFNDFDNSSGYSVIKIDTEQYADMPGNLYYHGNKVFTDGYNEYAPNTIATMSYVAKELTRLIREVKPIGGKLNW